ncbi:MAG: oligopeptide transporter, OPT family [Actinomycetaceae bacterium]|nr:oligopeptide transporter, OPT family [Actinomycetaceae bacterium]MDY6083369.1 oligopeptide transporter, OPT family [Actinomycetaceae bacterium]
MAEHSAPKQQNKSSVKELTLRGVIIGGLITLVFTAANTYLGLKVGLTFATSIPAAVISMAILRKFADHTVVENNIVQTIASAAGTLSAIIFVLPGLAMIGWWQGFPFWTTTAVCFVGGILGVTYSVPLRRALVTGSDLPYPEGVAAAEVLKVGDTHGSAEENKRGLSVILWGSIASAGMQLLVQLKGLAAGITKYLHVGAGGLFVGGSFQLSLMGIGHLVGPAVGVAQLVGIVISYFVLLPVFTGSLTPADGQTFDDFVGGVFSNDVRMVGAGAMAIAAVWTLVKIMGPIVKGIKDSLASSRKRAAGEEVPVTERDIPFKWVAIVTLASMVPIAILLWLFLRGTNLENMSATLVVTSVVFILVIGLVVASICGYMAGLIGASNSPVSGVGIIVVLISALLIYAVTGDAHSKFATDLIAYTLFTTAIVFGVATISNDNLQDLKTGQLVGATPWKQQVALMIGVFFGSVIIPPVLQLLMNSFGFLDNNGALIGGTGGDTSQALQAPQAGLLSTISKGIFNSNLDWGRFGLGLVIGAVLILVDELLKKFTRYSLSPLAVGMGMYLMITTTLMIVAGSFIGLAYDKWAEKQANSERYKRLGVLLATGFIVGESLFQIVVAAIVGGTGNSAPIALPFFSGEGWTLPSEILGFVVFFGLVFIMYKWVGKKAAAPMASESANE